MPKLLLAPDQRGWPHFQRLMTGLLSFLEPYLRNADLTEAIRMLYKVGPTCSPAASAQLAFQRCPPSQDMALGLAKAPRMLCRACMTCAASPHAFHGNTWHLIMLRPCACLIKGWTDNVCPPSASSSLRALNYQVHLHASG